MREEQDYKVFDYDQIKHGQELKIDHSIYLDLYDISGIAQKPLAEVQAMYDQSVEGEHKAFEIVLAAVKQWEKQAAVTQKLRRGLDYLKTLEVSHTANQWVRNERSDWDEISNKVYKMSIHVYESHRYDRSTKEMVPEAWYVSWDLRLNSPSQHTRTIAGQRQKKYTDKAAAEKYIVGRKKAYAHLFTEISPPIPQEYASDFMVNGLLLPGYRVEGTEHTAAEQKEVSDGGISVSGVKPSVLKKLDQAKQDRPAAAPDPAAKKKEDVSL